MKVLCLDIPQPHATMEAYQPHMLNEVHQAWKLYKDGFIRDIYFRQDRPGVAIIAEADSVEHAKQLLDTFPLSQANLIDWQVIPLGPFANWELLFAPATNQS